jgi:hypothetical protein
MRIAIVQSNYIPWKGYFDLMRSVDEFVLFDDVQYTRRDWRNRNRIKTPRGPAWLTIPVNTGGHYLSPIKDITVSDAHGARIIGERSRRTMPRHRIPPVCRALRASISRESGDPSECDQPRWLEALCEILDG